MCKLKVGRRFSWFRRAQLIKHPVENWDCDGNNSGKHGCSGKTYDGDSDSLPEAFHVFANFFQIVMLVQQRV